MENVLKFIVGVLPIVANVLLPLIGAAALWLLKKYLDKQANDVDRKCVVAMARGTASLLEAIAAKTKTQVDDAIAKMVREVADELGGSLNDKAKKIVAGVAHGARANSLDLAALEYGRPQISTAQKS
jgi:hypothetical protein